MFEWLKSCARNGRKISVLRAAVFRAIDESQFPMIERVEPRYFLDSCDYGVGNSISWTGTSANDNVTVEVSSGQLLVKNGGTTICSATAASVTQLTLTGDAGDDTVSGDGSPIAVTIRGGAGRDLLIGSGNNAADDIDGGADEDTLRGGLGDDTLEGGTSGPDWVDYTDKGTTAVTVNLSAVPKTGGTSGETDHLNNITHILGGNGNDTLTGDGNPNKIFGSDGADSILRGRATTRSTAARATMSSAL